MSEKWKPQNEDYFVLTGVGFYNGQPVPSASIPSSTDVYYTTYYNREIQKLGYTFLYWDSLAVPNPISGGVPYLGVYALNGIDLVLDTINIANNTNTTAVIDLISVNPANVISNGENIIPPKLLKRYNLTAEETLDINSLDTKIPFISYEGQTDSYPYYIFGDGVGVAFPNSIKTTASTTGSTTVTTTVTTTIAYGVDNISISVLAHFEK